MSRDTPLPPLTDAEIEMLLHEYGSRWPYEAAAIARLCRDLQAAREALREIAEMPEAELAARAQRIARHTIRGSQ